MGLGKHHGILPEEARQNTRFGEWTGHREKGLRPRAPASFAAPKGGSTQSRPQLSHETGIDPIRQAQPAGVAGANQNEASGVKGPV
ncbi:hypothetical protein AA105894_3032 [Asaia spathodeae NBRC 105894]|nr:hypothetical protein AA105894_3032 [Asaia spathodeae NBRC 105894]